jgi:hypothetical protein
MKNPAGRAKGIPQSAGIRSSRYQCPTNPQVKETKTMDQQQRSPADLTIGSVHPTMQIGAARSWKGLPDAYRLIRYRTDEGAVHLKLQGYFIWTQGWSQRGGEWKDIETVDADDLSDDKPYCLLL